MLKSENPITLKIYIFACRYDIKPVISEEDIEVTARNFYGNSMQTSVMDLQMGVETFCKAFPWHFVIDRRLELVQIGSGFMRLFGCHLATLGTAAATYFEFHRPRNINLSFNEIVKRANTPFVLSIRKLPGVELLPAEVSCL